MNYWSETHSQIWLQVSSCRSRGLTLISQEEEEMERRSEELFSYSKVLKILFPSQNFLLLRWIRKNSFFRPGSLLLFLSSSLDRTTPHLSLSLSLFLSFHTFIRYISLSFSLNSVHSPCPFSPLCILEQPLHVLLRSFSILSLTIQRTLSLSVQPFIPSHSSCHTFFPTLPPSCNQMYTLRTFITHITMVR